MMLLPSRYYKLKLSTDWQDWFAWFPVVTDDGLVWLETVQYAWDGSGYDPDFIYRRKK